MAKKKEAKAAAGRGKTPADSLSDAERNAYELADMIADSDGVFWGIYEWALPMFLDMEDEGRECCVDAPSIDPDDDFELPF